MLLKKFIKTSLVAAAAISMSTAAMAEAKVTTSVGGFVDVRYQMVTTDNGTTKATDNRINQGQYDTVESEMNFVVKYDNGDKKVMLKIYTREEDGGTGALVAGSQKVGDYTVGGVLKDSAAFTSSSQGHSVARTFIATKSWKFLMGSHLKSYDGNQAGNSYNMADYTFASDLQGDPSEYDTSMVFDYMMDGVKLTLVKSLNNENSANANKGLIGSNENANAAVTGYDVDSTAVKVNYKKDQITAKVMYAFGEIKGNKENDASADGYKKKATSLQIGFQFDAGMAKPFVNYSSVSVEETGGVAAAWTSSKKNGNGFTSYEIGADLDLGEGLYSTVVYSARTNEDDESAAVVDKGDEYTSYSLSVKKTIGSYYIGAGYGAKTEKDKAASNAADDIKYTAITFKTGYTF